jgi:hypothetical protein
VVSVRLWAQSASGRIVVWLMSVAAVSAGLNGLAEARRWAFWRGEAEAAITETETRAEAQVAAIRAPTVTLEGFWTVTLVDGEQRQGLVGLRSGIVEVARGSDVFRVPAARVRSISR